MQIMPVITHSPWNVAGVVIVDGKEMSYPEASKLIMEKYGEAV